jgi:hypothetical protein
MCSSCFILFFSNVRRIDKSLICSEDATEGTFYPQYSYALLDCFWSLLWRCSRLIWRGKVCKFGYSLTLVERRRFGRLFILYLKAPTIPDSHSPIHELMLLTRQVINQINKVLVQDCHLPTECRKINRLLWCSSKIDNCKVLIFVINALNNTQFGYFLTLIDSFHHI